jgi:predicted HD superfamily hydrolase involved in NAD metabolism
MELKEIQKEVEKSLSEKRFYHSICVMNECEKLAIKYGVDYDKAKKVGISHDIAKEMSEEDKLKYIVLNNIEINDTEKRYPTLLHAKIGADICSNKFGFDIQMKQAIESHTTGKENMDMLAKILYMADWVGIDRNFADTEYIRDLAYKNIDEAIIYSLNRIIKEKVDEAKEIHVDTISTRNKMLRDIIGYEEADK